MDLKCIITSRDLLTYLQRTLIIGINGVVLITTMDMRSLRFDSAETIYRYEHLKNLPILNKCLRMLHYSEYSQLTLYLPTRLSLHTQYMNSILSGYYITV